MFGYLSYCHGFFVSGSVRQVRVSKVTSIILCVALVLTVYIVGVIDPISSKQSNGREVLLAGGRVWGSFEKLKKGQQLSISQAHGRR